MAKKEDFLELEGENILEIVDTIKSSLDKLENEKMLEFVVQHYGLISRYINGLVKCEKNLKLFYPSKPVEVYARNKKNIAMFLVLLEKAGSLLREE